MSDTVFHLGQAAKNIKSTPPYQPYSKVRIIVGEDADGTQLVCEAGDDSARILEIKNPYGTQAMANAILNRIRGYQYVPYTADGAILNPAAELGDGISVGGAYSVIASAETTLSPIMSANVAAYEDGEIDHEYPYQTPGEKDVVRKINNVYTNFIVELGRVQSTIAETYETKADAATTKTTLQSQITQTASSILSTVSATYETKTAASQMETRLQSSISQTASSITSTVAATYETKADATAKLNSANGYTDTVKTTLQSQITQTANSIKSTVSSATVKYQIPSGITIQNYGYGVPDNSTAKGKNNQYYLDQASGYYYKSNNTSWVRQNSTPLQLITSRLESMIRQTASSIALQVSGANAPEWKEGDYYAKDDVVKVTTIDADGIVTSTWFYKATSAHTATSSNKPPSNKWEAADAPTVQSLIDINIDGITLSAGGSSSDNSAKLTISKDGVQIDAVTITMSNVVADTIKAKAEIDSPEIYAGRLMDHTGWSQLYMWGSRTSAYLALSGYVEDDDPAPSIYDTYFVVHRYLEKRGNVNYPMVDFYVDGDRKVGWDGYSERMYMFGTWDFSNATVIGI